MSELAKADVRGARRWYDDRRAGLGDEFLADLHNTLNKIAAHPNGFARVASDVRSLSLNRFPYVVYYRDLTECVVVLAVLHAHRDPRLWRTHL